MSLRVQLTSIDAVRRRGLEALLNEAGHVIVEESPDVVVYDGVASSVPAETEAPVLALTDAPPFEPPAGWLPRDADPGQIDLALRAIAGGLVVRAPTGPLVRSGFRQAEPLEDHPPLTARETEILALVGRGLSNKAIARELGISVHTVKFHLEAMFSKLDASSRAEAVAKGLSSGVITL
jgi:two-component system, NarL family, nitrate/nitrite response regulator NarL